MHKVARVMEDVINQHFPHLSPLVPSSPARTADDLQDAHKRGLASATSMLWIGLNEIDGSDYDRSALREITRRVVQAYFDQMQRQGGGR